MIRVPANEPHWTDQRVCVIGAGYMGGGIGQILALAGARVQVADVDEPTAQLRARAIVDQARAFVDLLHEVASQLTAELQQRIARR